MVDGHRRPIKAILRKTCMVLPVEAVALPHPALVEEEARCVGLHFRVVVALEVLEVPEVPAAEATRLLGEMADQGLQAALVL